MDATTIIAMFGIIGTLAGTLGGTVLSHFLTGRREIEIRNREKKEQVYEEYNAFMLLSPDRVEGVGAQDVSRIFSGMNIYGSKHIQTASKQLFALRSEVNKATDPEVKESLTNALERVRTELLDAIRQDLGVDD